MTLWHITTKAAWDDARTAGGLYRPASFDTEGFIHLSTARQWLRTANRFYRGQGGLVRLGIDETQLGDLRFEAADGDWFPHLYEPLPTTAVTEVHDLPCTPDGAFVAAVPAPQAAVAARAIETLSPDSRFLGLAAAGSWLTGTMDALSDVDLAVLCTDADRDAAFADREALLARLGRVLVSFTGEHVGERRLVIALLGAPLLHVDVKFVTASELAGQGGTLQILWERDGALTAALTPSAIHPDRQWIEDRFWVWVHYGATKIARGELFEALDHLSFVRVRALGPMASFARGNKDRGVRFVERDLPRFAERLRATVATLDAADLTRALEAAVEIYRELRQDVEPRREAERAAVAFLAEVRAVHGQP